MNKLDTIKWYENMNEYESKLIEKKKTTPIRNDEISIKNSKTID